MREALVKVQLSSSGSNSSRLDVSTFADALSLLNREKATAEQQHYRKGKADERKRERERR